MADKLTDTEIKKALGCCANCESCDFETTDCPLGEEMECRSLLAKYALDFINRLEAENENYSRNNKTMTKDILDLQKALKQLSAENEKLKSVLPEKSGVFTVIANAVVYTKTTEDYDDFLKKVYTAANKEFVERLKKGEQYSVERHENIVPVAVIDWILKEMVEGNNGK